MYVETIADIAETVERTTKALNYLLQIFCPKAKCRCKKFLHWWSLMIADFRKQNSRKFLNKAKSSKLQETYRK